MVRKIEPKIGVLFLLSTFLLVAIDFYSYAASSDLSGVYGAAEIAGCKGPCSVSSVTVPECYHPLPGQACDLDYCTANELRYSQCAVGNPAGEDPKCDVTYDASDWWRRQTIRKETCANGNASGNVPYGDACSLSGTGATTHSTPCKTGACSTGPIQLVLTSAGKPKCN